MAPVNSSLLSSTSKSEDLKVCEKEIFKVPQRRKSVIQSYKEYQRNYHLQCIEEKRQLLLTKDTERVLAVHCYMNRYASDPKIKSFVDNVLTYGVIPILPSHEEMCRWLKYPINLQIPSYLMQGLVEKFKGYLKRKMKAEKENSLGDSYTKFALQNFVLRTIDYTMLFIQHTLKLTDYAETRRVMQFILGNGYMTALKEFTEDFDRQHQMKFQQQQQQQQHHYAAPPVLLDLTLRKPSADDDYPMPTKTIHHFGISDRS